MPSVLEQLRDIHVPPPVSWWPPAPGYWIGLLLVLMMLSVWLIRYWRNRTRRMITRELEGLVTAFDEHQDEQRLARDISVLMRRAALTIGTRREVAGVTGDAWIATLEKLVAPQRVHFSAPVKRALTLDIYAPHGVSQVEELVSECRQWIAALPLRRGAE